MTSRAIINGWPLAASGFTGKLAPPVPPSAFSAAVIGVAYSSASSDVIGATIDSNSQALLAQYGITFDSANGRLTASNVTRA